MSTEDKIQRSVLPVPEVKHVGLDSMISDFELNDLR